MRYLSGRAAPRIISLVLLAGVFLLVSVFLIRPQSAAFADERSDFSAVLPTSFDLVYDGRERTISPVLTGFSENAEFSWTKDGKTFSSSPFITVKNASDSGEYVLTVTENGKTYVDGTVVKISPKHIKAKIGTFVCFYGEEPSLPEYEILSSPAYGDDEDSIGFFLEPVKPTVAGTYEIRAYCRNENYYTDATGSITVLKKAVKTKVDFPPVLLITRGETLKFTFTSDGFVGSDDAAVTVMYHKLNERGVPGIGSEEITSSGRYVLTAFFNETQRNYELSLDEFSREIIVYPREKEVNGIEIFIENGFVPSVNCDVVYLDKENYAKQYERPLDLQRVYDAFAVDFHRTSEGKMEVRVPVTDEKSYYTVAFVSYDDTLKYMPCEIKDGFVTFEVSTAHTVFILWKDKDYRPYALACVLLALLLVSLVFIFIKTYKKYKSLRFSAYSFLPLIGAGSIARNSVYFFAFSAIALGFACLVFAVATVVVNARIRFLRKKGK